jgi:hypothetical protein
MIMLYFLYFIEKQIKERFRGIFLVGMLTSEVASFYGDAELSSYSIGYDFTAMDRSESASILVPLLLSLAPNIGARVAGFIAHVVVFGALVCTKSVTFWRRGGNPSGQLWTTMLNCLVALFLHTATLHRLGWLPKDQMLCDDPRGVDNKVRSLRIRIVGDDGLIMSKDSALLDEYKQALDFTVSLVFYTEGTGIKWDAVVAPPTVGSVFLDTFIGRVAGRASQIPSRFSRSVPRIYQVTDSPRADVLRGLTDRASVILLYLQEHDWLHIVPRTITFVLRSAMNMSIFPRSYDALLSIFIYGEQDIPSPSTQA